MSKSSVAGNDPAPFDFWKLFQNLPEAYLLFEANYPDFTIIEANAAREALTGIPRDFCIGRKLFDVFPDTSERYRKTGVNPVEVYLRQLLKTGKVKRLDPIRYDLVQPDGAVVTKYWQPSYIPLRDAKGHITHIVAASRDITDEVQTEHEMAKIQDRLTAALAIGKVGSWVWDIAGDQVIGDKNLARLFGMNEHQITGGLTLERFMQSVHPEDRVRVNRSIRRTVRERVLFDEEYRTVTTDGKVRWVLARGNIEERGSRLLFPGVIVDITERRDLQAQVELARRQDQLNRRESKILQKRNEELETISRTKDEFVALASHQLRTPATAVKQYLGMVLQGYVGDITEIQSEMLHKAFESNERQIQIINQILNAARADTGRLAMTMMPIDACALLRGIADDMRASLEQRGHVFTVNLPKTALHVLADIGYLRMAIENVLHNANVYTPEGGRVRLHVGIVGKQVQISVTDTGVGIKKADISKLFTKFSRIHNPLSVQAGGSGIGLYLTAEIVRLHGGTVTVESKIKQGTTFAILLPLEHNSTKAERTNSAAPAPAYTSVQAKNK